MRYVSTIKKSKQEDNFTMYSISKEVYGYKLIFVDTIKEEEMKKWV
ncbi:MAG TPA: hypothetical protein PLP33_23165 [Leptospiraceae bacterium]|nr:hypothetical protein [Leptospiraceae bacterium]